MHSLLPLALFGDFSAGQLSALLIPIAAIILAGVITVTGMYFHHRRKELWHATARLALEKGQPLPPMDGEDEPRLKDAARESREMAQHDVRGGLVLIAVGAGLWLMLGGIHQPLRYVGAIPGFIGLALLLFAIGRALFASKPEKRNDPAGRS